MKLGPCLHLIEGGTSKLSHGLYFILTDSTSFLVKLHFSGSIRDTLLKLGPCWQLNAPIKIGHDLYYMLHWLHNLRQVLWLSSVSQEL